VFLECDSLISVNIPAEFTKIGDYAFFRCTYLSSVAFEDNSHLSEIGVGAFAETALVNVVFPQGLKVIKSTAFNNIPTLTSVTFPNTLERIDSSAFNMCPLLDNLIFPDSLYAIGDSAFYLTKWMTDKAEGPVYAGKVFYSYKLNTVPNTTITSITINEGTIGIAGGSFMNLRGVTELTVPASVKYIDLFSIMSCGITTVNIERSLLVDGSITAAYNHFISGCSVYVPADSYEEYITAPVWKNYAPPYTYFKINGFKVDFNTLGGSAIKSQYIENGGKAVEPNEIISKEGYHLIGWYTAAEGGELFDFETAITANITLYAKYEADTQNCTVTFDTMGGTSLDPAIKGYSGMLAIPAQPKRLGFTFDGWYLDNALTQEAEFPMMITSNITLYAKWLPNDGTYNSPKKLTFGEITVGINNTLYYYFVSETDVVLSIVSNRLVRQDPYIYIYLEDGSYYNDIYKNNYFMFDGKINLLAGELYLISIENWDGELSATFDFTLI
ncbi:MAG TPA: leucine-rich repeat protein, partial [Clostridia bacterium]|nr:leucine-rich repeat protein [Clostridia bacterium]